MTLLLVVCTICCVPSLCTEYLTEGQSTEGREQEVEVGHT
jgi:hypothetical protein